MPSHKRTTTTTVMEERRTCAKEVSGLVWSGLVFSDGLSASEQVGLRKREKGNFKNESSLIDCCVHVMWTWECTSKSAPQSNKQKHQQNQRINSFPFKGFVCVLSAMEQCIVCEGSVKKEKKRTTKRCGKQQIGKEEQRK